MENTGSLPHPPADGVYEIGGLFPVWGVVVIAGTAWAAVTFFATSNTEPPRLHWVRIQGSLGREGGREVFPAGVLSAPLGSLGQEPFSAMTGLSSHG